MATALAVDLGSSSGRVLAGTLTDGRIDVTEIHRFAHEAIDVDGVLVWDIDRLYDDILAGLLRGVAQFDDAVSVSIDTWGVDFVTLDARGHRLGHAVAYRDERTSRTLDAFRDRLPDDEFFALTGIAPVYFNTANQLFAMLDEEPERASRVDQVLLLPDYFAWRLTGVRGWTRTIASTTGLCVPGAAAFSDEVLARLGIPRSWFGDVAPDLGVVGPCIVEGLQRLKVVRGGAHDSACAVHGLPLTPGVESHFLSSGSWSVLGAMLDEPVTSPEAFRIGLTNEVRTDGGVRPLFNITGLWMLQECQREWTAAGVDADIVGLIEQASAAATPPVLIDPDDPRFTAPGGMVDRIGEAIVEQGGERPEEPGECVRVVLESLAQRYARGVRDLGAITGRRPGQLNVVGGGSRNALLCQLTADATGLPVVAGPAEAATLGAMVAQFEAMGLVGADERSMLVTSSASTTTWEPGRGKG